MTNTADQIGKYLNRKATASVRDTIIVRYSSIDHFSETRRFATLAGAQAYAHRRIGPHPDQGSGYAVSDDGVGKITVRGATLGTLFPSNERADAGAPRQFRRSYPAYPGSDGYDWNSEAEDAHALEEWRAEQASYAARDTLRAGPEDPSDDTPF